MNPQGDLEQAQQAIQDCRLPALDTPTHRAIAASHQALADKIEARFGDQTIDNPFLRAVLKGTVDIRWIRHLEPIGDKAGVTTELSLRFYSGDLPETNLVAVRKDGVWTAGDGQPIDGDTASALDDLVGPAVIEAMKATGGS